jgi:hypothetical protein
MIRRDPQFAALVVRSQNSYAQKGNPCQAVLASLDI